MLDGPPRRSDLSAAATCETSPAVSRTPAQHHGLFEERYVRCVNGGVERISRIENDTLICILRAQFFFFFFVFLCEESLRFALEIDREKSPRSSYFIFFTQVFFYLDIPHYLESDVSFSRTRVCVCILPSREYLAVFTDVQSRCAHLLCSWPIL